MTKKEKLLSLGVVIFFMYTLVVMLESCSKSTEQKKSDVAITDTLSTFVGSSTCQYCHSQPYKDWLTSDHYQAMSIATESTVKGDFNNASLSADGTTSRFFRKEGKFFISTQGDDGKNHDYEVLYTFGFFPLQQYLVAFPGGRMQVSRASWDTRENKWFNQYAGQKVHHRDWLHWTGNGQNWNTMCASCHSTNLQKNYDFASDSYSTTWDEINVSCESCHGPGKRHVDFLKSPEYQSGERLEKSGFLYAKDSSTQLELNTCAPCHARKAEISQKWLSSSEIMDNLIPQVISNEFYFADGQISEEDFEYGSFTQSKMFHNNVRCSNCHNPHSGKLITFGNELCMSCHQPSYNTKEHHFHPLNTESAQCISCHMPVKTFMGNDHRRDHSFRIPRPDQSVVFGTPNTCTSCHSDKSSAWASTAIKKWYGNKRAYHFSDDLLPGSQLTDRSEEHLIKLLADTDQPEIARATAAYYLTNIQTQQSVDALLLALRDKKPLVRYHALRSLENFRPEVWQHIAHESLSDKVRAVRIAAADLYHRLPPEAIPSVAREAYYQADKENRKYLQYQTDFAVGNVMLADYELQDGDYVNAIVHYLHGLEKDSLMNYARLNLSVAYNSASENEEALAVLKDAAIIDPKNDRIFYNLGLLHYEMQDIAAAINNFQKAVQLGSVSTSLYYNYGLLLQQQGKLKDAEQILLQGFALNRQALNINYALAFFYVNQKLPNKARVHAQILQQLDPANPEYQALYRNLGL